MPLKLANKTAALCGIPYFNPDSLLTNGAAPQQTCLGPGKIKAIAAKALTESGEMRQKLAKLWGRKEFS